LSEVRNLILLQIVQISSSL